MLCSVPAVEKVLNFATGPYGITITFLKSYFLHAREDQKIASEPNFHRPRSQITKIRVDNQYRVNFSTLDYMGKKLESGFMHAREYQKK